MPVPIFPRAVRCEKGALALHPGAEERADERRAHVDEDEVDEDDGDLCLIICDENGKEDESIGWITTEGKLYLCRNLSKEYGLILDADGRIELVQY